MYYVYILQSENDTRKFYRGITKDLRQRLKDHNKSKSSHTAKFKPWKIIFYAAFDNKETAINFEKYLKTASGIAFARKELTP